MIAGPHLMADGGDQGHRLARLGVVAALAMTLLTGVYIAIISMRPSVASWLPSMRTMRPMHTLGMAGMLLCGLIAMRSTVFARLDCRATFPGPVLAILTLVFLGVAAAEIAMGRGSGLEYIGWPLWLTWIPIGVLAAMAWDTIMNLDKLSSCSGEGAWLLLIGLCLTPLGMIERVAGADVHGIARSLTVEWHALDTVFAGFNTALYGLGILLVSEPGSGRPPRSPWLYCLSVFALLSTFGHHHYMSGQPGALKQIAFVASMLGILSFVRHVRSVSRRNHRTTDDPSAPLFRTASAWMIFAVGTGVLIAIPRVNLVLHGTHAIVGHAMGAVIGVDVMIILAGLLSQPGEQRRTRTINRYTTLSNIALSLMALNLFAAGVAKGFMRMSHTHSEYLPVIRGLLAPLPILGIALSAGLLGLARAAWSDGVKQQSPLARHARSERPPKDRSGSIQPIGANHNAAEGARGPA